MESLGKKGAIWVKKLRKNEIQKHNKKKLYCVDINFKSQLNEKIFSKNKEIGNYLVTIKNLE